MQVIVLGMHRSGTSAVTRLLNLAGCWFGPEGIATDPNEENPKGFWERRDVRAVCDALLQGSGFDWWKLAGFSADAVAPEVRVEQLRAFEKIVHGMDAHRPWVLKEPRMCVLLPVLRPVLEVPVAVIVTREPLEVARSLRARDEHMHLTAGFALWEVYTRAAFAHSQDMPRVHIRYADLLADPAGVTTQLIADLTALGVAGLRTPTEQEVTAFVAPDLRRQREPERDRSGYLTADQARLATSVDDGSILEGVELEPSGVATDALVWLARSADERQRIEELDESARESDRLIATATEERNRLEAQLREQEALVRARDERVADLEARVADLERRIERMVDVGTTGVADIARQLDAVQRSSTWRMARRAQRWQHRLRLQPTGEGPLAKVQRRAGAMRAELEGIERASRAGAVARLTDPALVRRTRPAAPPSGRPSLAVLVWDVGHNPIGRANVLAEVLARKFDVEMWGAQFERYGMRVWAPLRDIPTPVNVFPGRPFPDHLAVMEEVASRIDADAIFVSKPRLPSYLLGVLAKEARNRPLLLDVDDHELAFFAEDEGLDATQLLLHPEGHDLTLPFERDWTRAADAAIAAADAVTVSNVALQQRYGGTIFPHARDERTFDPELYDRAEVRRRIGVAPDEKLLLFGGTPRAHKGVVDILRALDRIGDPRNRLLVFGTKEFDELRADIGPLERWAIALPYQPIGELPALVGAADLACVLQDPDHPVSRYQMPAKITDALAMQVPCLVHATPPLQGLIDDGILIPRSPDEPLEDRIASILATPDEARERAKLGRERFLTDFSYEAVSERIAPELERLIADPPPLDPRLSDLAAVPRRMYGPGAASLHTNENGPPAPTAVAAPRRPRRLRGPSTRSRSIVDGEPFDVVMFWKQNDTGIYGRRQDMFLKYLARSPRVGTIVHFDNPVTPEKLVKSYREGGGRDPDQSRLVVRRTVARLARRHDLDDVFHHTFVHAGPRSKKVGLPPRSGYPGFAQSVLTRHGVGERPWVLWAYPTNPDLPELIDALHPDLVVADVVDDNRTWYEPGSRQYDRTDVNYEEVLGRSDIVIANCDPVAEAMQRFADEVLVVPNGLELDRGPRGPRPRELRGFDGPVIGYVGNLSHRLDIDLLDELAEARPRWQFVFVGSAHLDQSILRLGARPNVHFVGVKPYLEALDFVRHFAVALIPHVDNDMTRAMNPLKAYVYCAEGVPVVSTPIANLGPLESTISIARGRDEFLAAIEAGIAAGHVEPDPEAMWPHSWEQRVEEVLRRIDEVVGAEDQ